MPWSPYHPQPKRRPLRLWDDDEIAYMREQAGVMPWWQIADKLDRSEVSVIHQACRLGISLERAAISPREFSIRLGIRSGLARKWIDDGWLLARQWAIRTRIIDAEECERFLRECGWLYEPGKITYRPWQRIAEATQRRDPWLPSSEARALLGLSFHQFQRGVRLGLIPIRYRRKSGGRDRIVRASDIPSIRLRLAQDATEWQAKRRAQLDACAIYGKEARRARMPAA
jgi:hypothetical protein